MLRGLNHLFSAKQSDQLFETHRVVHIVFRETQLKKTLNQMLGGFLFDQRGEFLKDASGVRQLLVFHWHLAM